MPKTEVLFFCSDDGICPFLLWFSLLPEDVQNKCIVRLQRLGDMGFELRRPEADSLRDGIYELRASRQGIHYRILYFFNNHRAVVWNGIVKEARVPEAQTERALKAKRLFESNPERYTYAAKEDE